MMKGRDGTDFIVKNLQKLYPLGFY